MGTDRGADSFDSITVAVVGICGAQHVERCLHALAAQEDCPEFDVVAVHDPAIRGLDEVRARHPDVHLIQNEGQRTALELASAALRAATGDLILLTEDHCVPAPDWVRSMLDEQRPGRAAVGGRVETDPRASATDWAFYFVDFFRYAAPVRAGPSPSLTVCNVSYRRELLLQIRELWNTVFHETAVHDALRRRFGELYLCPSSEVTMSRNVSLGDALYERYAFGRLFACTRLQFVGPWRRACYTLFSPALPLLILARMTRKGLVSARLRGSFLRSFAHIALMAIWWSWGEMLGYLTRRHPAVLTVAPEIRQAERAATASGPGRGPT